MRFKLFSIILTALIFLIPNLAQAGDEVPLTTDSKEALNVFVQGRDLTDKLRTDEAQVFFDKAIQIDPNFVMAYIYRFQTTDSNIEAEKMLTMAEQNISHVTKGEQLIVEITRAFFDNNQKKRLNLAKQLVKLYPKDKWAHTALAWAYNVLDMRGQAIAQHQKVLKLDKNFSGAYNALGYLYRAEGEMKKAEEFFKKYIALLPDEPNPYDSIADLYTKMGKHKLAIKNYKRAIELNSTFVISQRKIGDNYVMLAEYDKARENYRKALDMELTPSGRVLDVYRIAESYIYEGKTEQAVKHCDKVLKMAKAENLPEWITYINSQKCRACIETGDLQKAEQCLLESRMSLKGSGLSLASAKTLNKQTVFNEAVIQSKKGNRNKALELANKHKGMIEIDKNPTEIENNFALVGLINFETGNYKEAVENLKKADSDNPHTTFILAEALQKIGNKKEAQKLFKKVAAWNQHSFNYSLVRNKALMAVGH